MKIVLDAPGKTILEAARKAGVHINADCGGNGTCGKCTVQVEGHEEVLACQFVLPKNDVAVYLSDFQLKFWSNFFKSSRGLGQRPKVFASTRQPESATSDNTYGVAFDIGTTTVVGIFCDLKTGKQIKAIARTNPQNVYGADIISRIQYAIRSPEDLKDVRQKIIDCLNEIIHESGIGCFIKKVAVVGNTAMSHFFLNVNPLSLARAPFEPAFLEAVTLSDEQLGIDLTDAEVHLLPNIAGYVGSDIVGVVLASEIYKLSGVSLVIDIGTNGEVLLAKDGEMLTCSTAAGPAFEGASISCGMRAAPGAIEKVELVGDCVRLEVIGSEKPIGLCGSGLISAVAQLLDAGIINEKGRLHNDFVLADGVVLTQKDVRELQLAKGAIAAGIQVLLEKMSLTHKNIDRVMLAGAFGNHIDVYDALRIGLLPCVAPERIIPIGNAAGAGACMALLSEECCKHAAHLAKKVLHVELSDEPNFVDIHMKSMLFSTYPYGEKDENLNGQ